MVVPTPHRRTETDRAFRVKENKRRHRNRHKEYVLDLERSVAQAQAQGIQATREMQLAAQRVASENTRLRGILREIGYSDTTIDLWASGEQCYEPGIHRQISVSTPAEIIQETPPARQPEIACPKVENTQLNGPESALEVSQSNEFLRSPEQFPHHVDSSIPEENLSARKNMCPENASLANKSTCAKPPCRLLTLLADNPSADITQVLGQSELSTKPNDGDEVEADSNGIECSTAYKMLMKYATSEDKMNKIAEALETGCTSTAGGGCKVKSSVMWKVLDEECT